MTTYYKVLHADGSCFHGGKGSWPLPTEDGPGEWVEVKGDLVACENGLHGCRIGDLFEWFGPAIFVMEFEGEVVTSADKALGRKARLVRATAWNSSTARLFAADCAERALKRERKAGREPDARSWEAVRVARAFARGEATSEDLAAAWDAAGATAWATARVTTGATAGAAARAAARVTAWDAAGDAARAAARAAAWDAARDAARATARAAARAADRRWQIKRLTEYLDGKRP